MKKTIAGIAVLVLVLSVAVAVAGDAAKTVNLKGWITCSCCAKKNANAEGKDCTIACAKNGAALVLFSEGTSYKLADQKAAMEHVGYEVVVSGVLAEDGSLRVESIKKAPAKA
jgi:hypothetical protein